MSDSELRAEKILLNIYKGLKSIEYLLDCFEEDCQPFLTIADGLDLEHTDTYLELTNPIDQDLSSIRLAIKNVKHYLHCYRKEEANSKETLPLKQSSVIDQPHPQLELSWLQNRNLTQENLAQVRQLLKQSSDFQLLYPTETLQVISSALSESRRLGHNFLGSEQLLFGILGEKTNQAALYLQSVSLTEAKLQQKIETRIGRGSGYVAQEIPHTPNVRRIFSLAKSYALERSPIAPEHLMLGILDLEESIAFQILQELLVDTLALRSILVETVQQLNSRSTEVIDTSYQIEQPELFAETIQITALPQENGRWACALKGNSSKHRLLIYADTKNQVISRALRQLATRIELET